MSFYNIDLQLNLLRYVLYNMNLLYDVMSWTCNMLKHWPIIRF